MTTKMHRSLPQMFIFDAKMGGLECRTNIKHVSNVIDAASFFSLPL